MRRRVTRALLTAAATGVTIIGLSLPASATIAAGHGGGVFTPSGGTPIATDANCVVPSPPGPPRATLPPTPAENCAKAGYQASGRDFRFAQALITVPDHPGSIVSPADPTLYVALDNSSNATWQYARVGIAPCPQGVAGVAVVPGGTITCPTTVAGNTSNWVVFAATADTAAGSAAGVTIAAEHDTQNTGPLLTGPAFTDDTCNADLPQGFWVRGWAGWRCGFVSFGETSPLPGRQPWSARCLLTPVGLRGFGFCD